jgi:hypothetical protein
MGIEDAARASVRAAMRKGWTIGQQRKHYQRMLDEAQAKLRAIDAIAAEAEAGTGE